LNAPSGGTKLGRRHLARYEPPLTIETARMTLALTINKVIPRNRCALARDIGFRYNNKAVVHLYEAWLPQSRELPGKFPIFFHYVNFGSNLREDETITDVYLPLRQSS
jgi:DNA gyrase inhibitor GyrI